MQSHHWGRNTLIAVGLVVAAIVAVRGGRLIGHHEAQTAKRAGMNAYLQSYIRGISRGHIFPDIPVWTPDGARSAMIRDLVPMGGVIFYVAADCKSCRNAVIALDKASQSPGPSPLAAVVVTSPEPDALLEELEGENLSVSLWVDQEDLLAREFGVRTTRTWFRLDDSGVVTGMGTAEFDETEYRQILRE